MTAAFAVILAAAEAASAPVQSQAAAAPVEPEATTAAPVEPDATMEAPVERLRLGEVRLESPPPWSLVLDGYSGLGVLWAYKAEAEPLLLAGGLLRLRVRHLVGGAQADVARLTNGNMQYLGAVAGGFIPFINFVDLEFLAGYGGRVYYNRGTRSTLGEYRVTVPSANLRIGLSDRAGGLFGVRVGAQLLTYFDFGTETRSWSTPPNKVHPEGLSGNITFGGTSIALLVTIGAELTPSAATD